MRMVLNQCLEDINWTDLKKLKCINICAPSSVGIHDIIRRKCYIFLMKIQVFSEKSLSIMFTPWTNKIYSENYEVFNRFWQTFFFLKKKEVMCSNYLLCTAGHVLCKRNLFWRTWLNISRKCHEDYVFMIFRWSATFAILNSWKNLFVRLIFYLLFIKCQIPGCTEEIIK